MCMSALACMLRFQVERWPQGPGAWVAGETRRRAKEKSTERVQASACERKGLCETDKHANA